MKLLTIIFVCFALLVGVSYCKIKQHRKGPVNQASREHSGGGDSHALSQSPGDSTDDITNKDVVKRECPPFCKPKRQNLAKSGDKDHRAPLPRRAHFKFGPHRQPEAAAQNKTKRELDYAYA